MAAMAALFEDLLSQSTFGSVAYMDQHRLVLKDSFT
jgi:hypothetical protein